MRLDYSINGREMPRYRSHKEVWALKIAFLVPINFSQCASPESWLLTPEDSSYREFEVSADYVRKHNPQPGGYYVVYKDGYESFSPAKAFEEGYTSI